MTFADRVVLIDDVVVRVAVNELATVDVVSGGRLEIGLGSAISVLLFLIAGAIGVKQAQDALAAGPRRVKHNSDATSGHVAHAH